MDIMVTVVFGNILVSGVSVILLVFRLFSSLKVFGDSRSDVECLSFPVLKIYFFQSNVFANIMYTFSNTQLCKWLCN